MAGDWMKIELELPDKPEVHYIAGVIGKDPEWVVGALIKVWGWFNKHTTDGNALGVTFVTVDRYAGVSGFGEAMMLAGWLEQNGSVLTMPKFDRHTSESAKSRALGAARTLKSRNKCNADTVTETLHERQQEKRREEKYIYYTDGAFEVSDSYLKVWSVTYPSLDVQSEITKAGAWCFANPKKAPKSDYARFLNGWLSRANPKPQSSQWENAI